MTKKCPDSSTDFMYFATADVSPSRWGNNQKKMRKERQGENAERYGTHIHPHIHKHTNRIVKQVPFVRIHRILSILYGTPELIKKDFIGEK